MFSIAFYASNVYDHGVPWTWVLGGVLASLVVLTLVSWSYLRLRRASRALEEAKSALDRQLEFQQAFIEMISCPVYVKDSQARYLAVNEAYEREVHCSRHHLLGKTALEAGHLDSEPEHARRLHAGDVALIASLGSEERELQFIDSQSGALRSAIIWAQAVKLATGPVLVGTIVETTAIRNAERKLAAFARAIPATVFEFEISAENERRFTFMEGRALQPFGLNNDDVVRDPSILFDLCNPDDRRMVADLNERALKHLIAVPATDFRIAEAGGWRWLRTEGGTPIRLPDGGATWSGYFIDVTELREKNEALAVATTQAEAATVAKSEFLATISHEVRTPMSDVIAMLELLSVSPLDQDQKSMLLTVKESARDLLHILGDVLDYSRIESGRMTIDPVAFNVRDLLDGLMEMVSPRASGKGLRLQLVTGWRVAGIVKGDALRIRQILFNLLDNAIKFTGEGGISVTVDVVRHENDRQQLTFHVRDTGIGIAEADLAALFQPFTQAERSTTRRFGGTGLGLSISHRLAEAMGGRVWLESRAGEGTSAFLELDLDVEPVASPPPIGEGRDVVLDCVDRDTYEAAYNLLAWLGFVVVAEGTPGRGFPALRVTDRRAPGESSVILLVESVTGDPQRPGIYPVCAFPLLQRALADACAIALGMERYDPELASGASAAPSFAGVRVLVAEDHSPNRVVIARQLGRLGCSFEVVQDGFQALAALERSAFDLLITDCHMPGMDGYALARAARRSSAGAGLVVFGMSASVGAEQLLLCRDAGMDDFIPKPLDLMTLSSKIVEHVGALPDRKVAIAPTALGRKGPAYLRDVFGGDEGALREFLGSLLDACHADMKAFAALDASDAKARRERMHRLEGALDLIDPAGPGAPPTEGCIDERLVEVQRRMALGEHLLEQLGGATGQERAREIS